MTRIQKISQCFSFLFINQHFKIILHNILNKAHIINKSVMNTAYLRFLHRLSYSDLVIKYPWLPKSLHHLIQTITQRKATILQEVNQRGTQHSWLTEKWGISLAPSELRLWLTHSTSVVPVEENLLTPMNFRALLGSLTTPTALCYVDTCDISCALAELLISNRSMTDRFKKNILLIAFFCSENL